MYVWSLFCATAAMRPSVHGHMSPGCVSVAGEVLGAGQAALSVSPEEARVRL